MSDITYGAYNSIDKALPGLLDGLDNQVEGTRVAKAVIQFGQPVGAYPGDEKSAYPILKDAQIVLFDADFVTANLVDITVNTVAMVQVPFNTDHDTTMSDVLVSLNNLEGVDAVLDATDSNNRTIVIRTKGAVAVVVATVTAGAGQAVASYTASTAMLFVGISCRTDNSQGQYDQYRPVNVVVDGYVWGEVETEAKANMPVYLGAGGLPANAGDIVPAFFRTNAAINTLAVMRVTAYASLGVANLF